MAQITHKRTGELLRALFTILRNEPAGLPAGDAIKRLSAVVPPTPFELDSFPSGGQRYGIIVRFATVDCTKAGWLAKQDGVWTLTDEGSAALDAYPDPADFYKQATKLYQHWKAKQNAAAAPAPNTAPPPPLDDAAAEQSPAVAFEQAKEQAWFAIEAHLRAMPPFDFQDLVADLLRAMGYHVIWTAPPGKDGGVDIIAHTDPLGTKLPRVKVQVKRVAQPVDLNTLKSFAASLDSDDDVGIFVSAGDFTKDAGEYARTYAKTRLTLINLRKLVDLWTEFFPRLEQKSRQRLPLTPIYFLTPED